MTKKSDGLVRPAMISSNSRMIRAVKLASSLGRSKPAWTQMIGSHLMISGKVPAKFASGMQVEYSA